MVYHKIQKGLALALATSMVATSIPAGDYRNVLAAAKQAEATQNETVTLADSDEISEDDEGVFKVTMDETGYLTADNEYAADESTPFSWDNVNTYFVITDRFYNGDPSNDHSYGRSGTSSTVPASYKSTFEEIAGSYAGTGEQDASGYGSRVGTFHGGDLQGLTKYIKEGYFDELGTNAIWITAPYEQVHGAVFAGGMKHYAYHGYYALDYTQVDANMGTSEDLHEFIDTAHEHGIRIIFDVVMNHSGYPDAYTIAEYYGADSSLLTSKWQQSYFGENESSYTWEWDYSTVNADHGALNYTDDWNSSWFTTDWQRMVTGRYGSGYTAPENNPELTGCSSGLPDFKTEDSSGKGLPDILKKKWTKEGQYDAKVAETNAMLNTCGYGNIGSASVKQYLVAWLANWVREYGVDGFRCDTAKHVELSCWNDLKTECNKALKEWRSNNPDKACSKWTDDFWMTGEIYEQGLSMSYNNQDYSSAFDSLINFSFQGEAGTTGVNLEGIYSDYAQYCNSGSKGNALSYVSSHDKGIGARGASVGTALLLCPGGVQTYYGDETSRTSSGGEHGSRSQMTWGDKACLANWQKVGRFRRNHISVGAGQHTKIADSPYTFSRTYTGKATVGDTQVTDYTDKVVVCLPGSAGTYDVSVGNVFADGTTVVDEYSETEYTVSGGQVSGVTCDSNGVILLAEPTVTTEKAKISASVASGKEYSEDSLTVKFTTKNIKDATYQINEQSAKSFTEEAEITIGEDTAYGEETTVVVKGTSTVEADNGQEVTQTYTYKRSAEPTVGEAAKGFYIRMSKADYEKESGSTSAPYIWVYDDDKASYSGTSWDTRDTMTLDDSGEYYIWSDESITTAVKVIVTETVGGKEEDCWRSVPDMKDRDAVSGTVELDPSKEYTDADQIKSIVLETGTKAKVTVNYVDTAGTVLKSVYRVGVAGKEYTVYAPKVLSTVKGYTLADDEETSKTGTFTEEESIVTFTYNKDDGSNPTPTPDGGEATSTPDGGVTTPTPDGGATPTPDTGMTTPTPDGGEATPTPDAGVATPTPDAGGATSTPDAGVATPTPDAGVATPTPDGGEATPTPDAGVATPTPDGGEVTPTPNSGNTTPTPNPGTSLDQATATPPTGDVNNNGTSTTPTAVPTNTPTAGTNAVTSGAVSGAVTEFEVSITTDPENTQVAGKKVKIEATAKGLDGDIVYRFEVENSAGIRETIQGYSANKVATWTPTKAGTFTLLVRAKDKTTGTIATTEKTFKVTPAALKIKKMSITKVSKLKRKIAISALGGTGKLKYKYTYKFKGKTKVLKKYSTSKSIKATFKKKGKYKITVFVKDTTGKVKKMSKTITIKK